MSDRQPGIGRIVTYRNRSEHYDLPAIVNTARDSWVEVGEAGLTEVPQPSSNMHVHLTVFSPGSTYQELDVLYDAVRDATVPPRTCRWPVIE